MENFKDKIVSEDKKEYIIKIINLKKCGGGIDGLYGKGKYELKEIQ